MDKITKLKAIQGLIIGLNEELYRHHTVNENHKYKAELEIRLINDFYNAVVELINQDRGQKPKKDFQKGTYTPPKSQIPPPLPKNNVIPKNELVSEGSSKPLDAQGVNPNKDQKGKISE